MLAAALIGAMASMPLALAGGIGIGVGESVVNYNYTGQRGLLDALLFVVVLAALLVTGRRTRARARPTAGGGRSRPRVKPVPAALQGKWWVRRLPAFGVGPVALVALFPLVLLDLPSQRECVEPRSCIYALVALSLTVLTGWAGQLSLGQFAFVGLGAMTTAALVRDGLGFIPSCSSPACVAALAAMVVGAPALRRPGLFLAVTTFAFAVMTSSWLLWRDVFLDGAVEARLSRQVIPLPAACSTVGGRCARRAPTTASAWSRSVVVLVGRRVAATQPAGPLDDRGTRQRARAPRRSASLPAR